MGGDTVLHKEQQLSCFVYFGKGLSVFECSGWQLHALEQKCCCGVDAARCTQLEILLKSHDCLARGVVERAVWAVQPEPKLQQFLL